MGVVQVAGVGVNELESTTVTLTAAAVMGPLDAATVLTQPFGLRDPFVFAVGGGLDLAGESAHVQIAEEGRERDDMR